MIPFTPTHFCEYKETRQISWFFSFVTISKLQISWRNLPHAYFSQIPNLDILDKLADTCTETNTASWYAITTLRRDYGSQEKKIPPTNDIHSETGDRTWSRRDWKDLPNNLGTSSSQLPDYSSQIPDGWCRQQFDLIFKIIRGKITRIFEQWRYTKLAKSILAAWNVR